MNTPGSASKLKVRWAVLSACAVMGVAGCATKDWVQDYVSQQNRPIESSVAQLDARVTQVDARVTQVAGQTSEARKVADDGVRKADGVNGRVTQALANRYKRAELETVPMRFGTGKVALTAEHKAALDALLKKLEENPTYTADVVGHTDAEGAKKKNYMLSWRRTEHVRRYLAQNGELLNRIAFIGMGEDLADGPERDAADRQVTVKVYRPME